MEKKSESTFSCIRDFVITYEEPRVIRIRSYCLSAWNWVLFIAIAGVIGGYFIWYKKGYQDIVPVESAVTTKLFGVDDTNTSDHTIWDNADYMIPPKENGAFTVITSVLVTPKQTQSLCDEDPSVPAGRCKIDSDCQKHKAVRYGNGIMTGKCINSTHAANVTVCQIKAWCPVEIDDPSKRSYLDSEHYTVFIKNNVRFPELGMNRQNIPDDMEREELATCLFEPKHPRNKNCPVFQINTIVEETGNSFKSIVVEGCVIEIVISWDCNFDYPRQECLPKYSFYRLDRREHILSRGFDLRFADEYVNKNGLNERTLYKAYGIRMIVSVQGRGRKFGFFVTAMTTGSGLSYFAIIAFVITKVVLPLYRKIGKIGSEPSLCGGTNCEKKLPCCLQPSWSRIYSCYKPLSKATRSEGEGDNDDLRAVHFDFKDMCKCGCVKQTNKPTNGPLDTHSKEDVDAGTVSTIDADLSEEPDHGGCGSSNTTGARVSFNPDSGVNFVA